MERDNNLSKNRIMVGNISFLAAILVTTVGCWNEYTWYEKVAPLGTLISFAFLGVTCLCYMEFWKSFKSPEFLATVAGCIIAGINLFAIGSNKGAILTVCDLLLVIYLFDKLIIPKKLLYPLTAYLAFYFYYWTIDVKGYFKGYNTNYGGLVLITGFIFALVGLFLIRDALKDGGKIVYARLMYIPILFMFAWGYNIIAWYRARCALLGFVVFTVLILIPKKVWSNKVFYFLLTYGTTVGAILVSLLYVLLGNLRDTFTIQIFYKDIISGREAIWGELWGAFLKQPITGIGSSYVMQVSWMDGMFEVHNGILDILFVHGVIVFAIVIVLLLRKLKGLNEFALMSVPQKCALAGVFAVLASSFMENFFIVPPFLLCFLALASLIRNR